jgi:site-specific DNA-methyltransferase (adenine-specific)
MPEALVKPCVLAGSKEGDTILDPFFGAGTTGLVALKNNRKYIGIELNPQYAKIAENRIKEMIKNDSQTN